MPVGTVTFLFTDIEGSTALLKRLGAQRYCHVLSDHQRLLREAFAEYGGHEIDTQGDSFFVAFRRAKDAVAGAIASQRLLAEHAWPDGIELRVRMGIHTGEPAVGGERYVGLGVLGAARGSEALDLAEQARPDLVLLEELELCLRLRQGEPGRSWDRNVPVRREQIAPFGRASSERRAEKARESRADESGSDSAPWKWMPEGTA